MVWVCGLNLARLAYWTLVFLPSAAQGFLDIHVGWKVRPQGTGPQLSYLHTLVSLVDCLELLCALWV
jgi:hypothetical protein